MNGPAIIAMVVANDVLQELGIPHGATITSAIDGKHSRGSKHYSGNAFDVRTFELSDADREKARSMMADRMGEDFDVVLESDHIHVEFDPKEAY